MSFFKKLFGAGAEARTPTVEEYDGYRIIPTPIPEGAEFVLSARIEYDREGETLTHSLIRADRIRSKEEAEQAAIFKARQMIDQLGLRLFD